MRSVPDALPFFFPASSVAEATTRIFALTGRTEASTRGEKRALVALRDALDLDVEIVRTNSMLGGALASALGVDWLPDIHTHRNTVSLAGLNVLLEGATQAYQAGSLKQLQESKPTHLAGPGWAEFSPARSKIEAVTRIAGLTNAPKEWLGPGSKEHKSVLVNLAHALFPTEDLDYSSKTRLAASLARALDVPWTDTCASTGETISLAGLNTILAGAERHLGRLGSRITDALVTPEDEGDALAAALMAGLPEHWDGRHAVTWLADQGLRGGNDNEWQGFYGEEKAKIVLAGAFAPGRTSPRARYRNTTFDYALNRVWDIKVHAERQIWSAGTRRGRAETILNDEQAIRQCVEDQGLGFLVVCGDAEMDESAAFLRWHRAHKGAVGVQSAPSNSGRSRTRKSAFDVTHVEAFWVPNTQALMAAIANGGLKPRAQGRQAPRIAGQGGSVRESKLVMSMSRARSDLRVARYERS